MVLVFAAPFVNFIAIDVIIVYSSIQTGSNTNKQQQ